MAESDREPLNAVFAEEGAERIAALLQLVEPVDDPRPLSHSEVEQFCHQLHALKGGAGLVGNRALADLAHRLEGELGERQHVQLVSRQQWRNHIDQLHSALGATAAQSPAAAAPLLALSQQRVAVEPAALDTLIHQMVEARVGQQQLLGQLEQLTDQLPAAAQRSLRLANQRQLVLLEAQQRQLLALRMVPINSVLPRWRELVRSVGAELDRSVELRVDIDTRALVDRTVLEQLMPLVEHLLRNAISHGIESRQRRSELGKPATGLLRVRCGCADGLLSVVVDDDGGGIDFDRLSVIAEQRGLLSGSDAQRQPLLLAALLRGGLSGAEQLSTIAGRGIGLAAVAATARDLGGALLVESEPGAGSRFSLQLPISVELRRVLNVEVGGAPYLLSGRAVRRVVTFNSAEKASKECGSEYPLADMAVLLGLAPTATDASRAAVLVDCDGWQLALRVDAVGDFSEQRVEPLGPPASGIPGVAGALLGDDGQPRLVLDLLDLLRAVRAGQLPVSSARLLDSAD